ncbi:AAA family ATPase [Streptomyces sp. UNOB3_S3]|uniref:AAA family ATPase n=1 Tax=Streptomyces sp. UNOB3_S3 TaxID=2871682 RepID=UPI0027E273A0|nr:AAA family ATPase [Streptomyces sp. UNOB3_S3]MCC3773750.1 ATP-binding protein [Streptomyces sp. UNOB3_S3]
MDHIRGSATVATATTPHGLTDLRGQEGPPLTLSYPAGTVLVVSGLPGSGKSTLLRRLSASTTAPAVDPRTAHEACEAVMPAWLPYAVYRPWARAKHFRWLRAEVRGGRPFLVHDCGSRAWMRRWLAREAARQGHELHLILLDVTASEALAGQEARGRWAPRRVFDRHRRGLDRLLGGLSGGSLPEAASVVLLDRVSRERVAAVEFAMNTTAMNTTAMNTSG